MQCCPTELSVMMEMVYNCAEVTLNVGIAIEELNF